MDRRIEYIRVPALELEYENNNLIHQALGPVLNEGFTSHFYRNFLEKSGFGFMRIEANGGFLASASCCGLGLAISSRYGSLV